MIKERAENVKTVAGYQDKIIFDSSKPDDTPRKLLDVSRLHALDWRSIVELNTGLTCAYQNFQKSLNLKEGQKQA